MRQSNGHRQVATLINALKQLCRSRGLRYREIAAQLGVTERTVKRWFAGHGLTLQIVEDLCNALGITFIELCEVAKEDIDTRPTRLGREQARELFSDLRLALVFILLTRGWSAQEIQRECGMPEALMVEHLVKLEKLKLVELLPGNKVRLLFARIIRWHESPDAGRAFARGLRNLFVEMDFSRPNAVWSSQVVNISDQALQELLAKFQALTLEVMRNADADRSSPTHKSWQALLLAAQPFDPLELGR
ncbi:MAG TPA: helix-turn-helix transcriptional regulator [Alphaproteobacteria bacterium]|jgi:transcriptional regulator with XRE-family HTH domain|nr:helix-turn-helix transcriptional regulator [Alphaproteobacteria bacterium]